MTTLDAARPGAIIRTWEILLAPIQVELVERTHHSAALAHQLDADHHAQVKPWSIQPLRAEGGLCVQRITTVGDDAAERLVTHLTPGTRLVFGGQRTVVLDRPHLIEVASELAIRSVPARSAHVVSFQSPVTFRSRNRFTPATDPEKLFRSISERWKALFGTDVSEDGDGCVRDVWVSDIEGRSESFQYRRVHVSGFVGRVRYVCESPEAAATWTAMLEFSRLVGLGSYTTGGLGTIDLEPTWNERTDERLAATS